MTLTGVGGQTGVSIPMEEQGYFERRVGTTLRGKWTLERLLGVGGMAAVYEAAHTKLGRRDAVKILHPSIANSADARHRFEQEAQAVNRLQHPGAIEVRDIEVTEDGAPFLVMELLDGESLAERLFRGGRLPPEEVFSYAEQILDVLGAAHLNGIIHRDIKPDNLFRLRDGRIKVLDFGVARLRQRDAPNAPTRTGALIGTVAYMAPEQVSGRSDLDGRADLFSVGATMFHLLTGRHLFPTDNELQLIMQMATEPAPALRSVAPEVGEDFATIVDRALASDRDQRYPSAAAMRADVLRVLGREPSSPSPRILPPRELSSSSRLPLSPAPLPTTSAHALSPSPPTQAPVTNAALSYQPTVFSQTPAPPAALIPAPPLTHGGSAVATPLLTNPPGYVVPARQTALLERLGRRTVSLPFPAVVALLAAVGLVVATLGGLFLWRLFAKEPERPPGSLVGPLERSGGNTILPPGKPKKKKD